MIRIREIDHLVLRVVNLDAMLKFYCDVLGCTIDGEEAIGLIQLRAGRSLLDLVPVDGNSGALEVPRRGRKAEIWIISVSELIPLMSPVFAVISKPMVWKPE